MTPGTLAALVAGLAFDDLAAFVEALPRPAFAVLREVADERVWAERWRRIPAPAPVVVGPPVDLEALLTAEEAARELRVSLDTLYARVQRGELEAEPRVPGGRLKFRRANLRVTPVASGIVQRYRHNYATPRGQGPAPPARLDTTRARRGTQCDSDDGRAMGTRRAHSHAARRHEPYAPGKAAWSGPRDPGPQGGGGA